MVRDLQVVLQDSERGFISMRSAWDDYGVKVHIEEKSAGGTIYKLDEAETVKRRQELLKYRSSQK